MLDLAKDTPIGENRQELAEEVLTKAFEVGAEIGNKEARTPWKAFTTGEWAQGGAGDNDDRWLGGE